MTLYSKWTLEHSIIFICSIIMAIVILTGNWGVSTKALKEKTDGYYDSIVTLSIDMKAIDKICKEESLSIDEYHTKYYGEANNYFTIECMRASYKIYKGYRAQEWRYLLLLTLAFPFLNLFLKHYNKNVCCTSLLAATVLCVLALIFYWGAFNIRIWIFIVLAIFTFIVAVMSNGFVGENRYGDIGRAASSAGKVRFCPYCGCACKAGDRFCQNCGNPL